MHQIFGMALGYQVTLIVFFAVLVGLSLLAELFRLLDEVRAELPSSVFGSAVPAESPRLLNGRFVGTERQVAYVNWRGAFAQADVVGWQPEGIVLREVGNENAQTFFRPWGKVFSIGARFASASSSVLAY